LFQVTISRKARNSIKRLPKHYKRRVIELLLIFRENPIPAEYYDIKKLKGYADTYRKITPDRRPSTNGKIALNLPDRDDG